MSNSTVATRSLSLPSGKVFVGTIYGLCVLGLIAVYLGEIVFTDHDPYKSEGPVESIITIGVFGSAALVVAVGLAVWSRHEQDRAKVGAILLGALSVLTLPFFWSGAPGIFGACAAWVAGLTKDGRPIGGAARVAGLVGVFIALLNIVVTIAGVATAGVMG